MMYTIIWTENGEDRWDRLENKGEVKALLELLANNSNVCETDIWVFTPEADAFAKEYKTFIEDIEEEF